MSYEYGKFYADYEIDPDPPFVEEVPECYHCRRIRSTLDIYMWRTNSPKAKSVDARQGILCAACAKELGAWPLPKSVE